MRFAMVTQLLTQMFKKPFTNKFPAKYTPASTTKFLEDVKNGKASIIAPVEVPSGFRGKIQYDKEKCTGCRLCTKVCPAEAVVFQERTKKIKYHLFRCTFCGECVKVCPVKALEFTNEFLLADYK